MIAILQPFIPHYREDFFKGLNEQLECDIFCYETKRIETDKFQQAAISIMPVGSIQYKGFLLYNPFTVIKKKYQTLVLMLNIGHLTTWLLLLTKFIHRKRIILWGHGISVKRYIQEEKKPSKLMRWMIGLSDGIWFYTEAEQELWKKTFPSLKSVSLNNTISDVDEIIKVPEADKNSLRKKYGIAQKRVLIFCARFNIQERRIDLLLNAIERLDRTRFGFIIIGDGNLKPDFTKYSNVYDFGALYDRKIKEELFQSADIYFQPGWVGLSIVEAMAYGKPVFSFKRTEDILQCVEYTYIKVGVNGLFFDNMEDLITTLINVDDTTLDTMGSNGKKFARECLSMQYMISSGVSLIANLAKR